MSLSRRCFLRFFGGATAGAMLSPLPWKLLDDAAIWTQNWSWIPRTPGGPVSWRHTTCTQCPAACGLRLRLVGERTVSAWNVAGHPVGDGGLCPLGLGIAQAGFHPSRLRGAVARVSGGDQPWRLVDAPQAVAEVGRRVAQLRDAGNAGALAILDLRPGRALSVLYGDFLAAAGGGAYLTLPDGPQQAAAVLNGLLDPTRLTTGEPGCAWERVSTLLSFGVAAPAACRPGTHVIQAAPNGSQATSQADAWLPILPGTEVALILGLAHVLRHELPAGQALALPGETADDPFWARYGALVADHTPEHVAMVTGLACSELRDAAGRLAARGPALVLPGGPRGGGPLGSEEDLAIWALNFQLGGLAPAGGVVLRPRLSALFGDGPPAPARALGEVPDGSLDLLLVDGLRPGAPLPGDLLRRKLRGPDSLVVAMSAFTCGPAAQADLVLPVAAPGEWLDDVPGPALAARASYAFAPAFAPAPAWGPHPADLLAELAAAAGLTGDFGRHRHQELLDRRVACLAARSGSEIFHPQRGASPVPAAGTDPRRLQQDLTAGGCWTEGPAEQETIALGKGPAAGHPDLSAVAAGRLPLAPGPLGDYPLVLVVEGDAVSVLGGALPPVVNKLYRESNLLPAAGLASLNPDTARGRGLRAGQTARLETPDGSLRVTVALDRAVRPGIVRVAPGPSPLELGDPDPGNPGDPCPDILTICGAGSRPVWRVGRAALREV